MLEVPLRYRDTDSPRGWLSRYRRGILDRIDCKGRDQAP